MKIYYKVPVNSTSIVFIFIKCCIYKAIVLVTKCTKKPGVKLDKVFHRIFYIYFLENFSYKNISLGPYTMNSVIAYIKAISYVCHVILFAYQFINLAANLFRKKYPFL